MTFLVVSFFLTCQFMWIAGSGRAPMSTVVKIYERETEIDAERVHM